jgi:hypothetical protein
MNNLKKNFLVSIIPVVGLISSLHANAADNNWYSGISLGTSTVETGVSNTTGTARLDEDDSGFKIHIGKKINKTISVEGFYADFGEASLTGNTGDNFDLGGTTYVFTTNNAKIATTVTGIGANAKFTHAFSDKSSISGRIGIMLWDVTASVSGASIASSTASSDGTDLFYGVGYKYNFNNKYAFTVDYDLYTADDADLNMVAVGVSYNF